MHVVRGSKVTSVTYSTARLALQFVKGSELCVCCHKGEIKHPHSGDAVLSCIETYNWTSLTTIVLIGSQGHVTSVIKFLAVMRCKPPLVCRVNTKTNMEDVCMLMIRLCAEVDLLQQLDWPHLFYSLMSTFYLHLVSVHFGPRVLG